MRITYRTCMEGYPHCHKKLKVYKTEERHIISVD